MNAQPLTSKLDHFSNDDESTQLDVLLSKDMDCLITPSRDKYTTNYNVTHRYPVKNDDGISLVVSTTTMDIMNLSSLRLVNIDGQHCIINGSDSKYREATKLTVESEVVGHRIMKDIIKYAEHKRSEVPKKYSRMNRIAEDLVPLITMSCAILLSLSASFWLIFN